MSQYNFENWRIKEWVKANIGNLRLLVSVLGGVWVTSITNAAWGSAAGILIKLVLDTLDYYVSD